MSKQSKNFLVIEDGLTPYKLSQRLTPKQVAEGKKEGFFDQKVFPAKVAPYTQKLQRVLKKQYLKQQKEYKKKLKKEKAELAKFIKNFKP